MQTNLGCIICHKKAVEKNLSCIRLRFVWRLVVVSVALGSDVHTIQREFLLLLDPESVLTDRCRTFILASLPVKSCSDAFAAEPPVFELDAMTQILAGVRIAGIQVSRHSRFQGCLALRLSFEREFHLATYSAKAFQTAKIVRRAFGKSASSNHFIVRTAIAEVVYQKGQGNPEEYLLRMTSHDAEESR